MSFDCRTLSRFKFPTEETAKHNMRFIQVTIHVHRQKQNKTKNKRLETKSPVWPKTQNTCSILSATECVVKQEFQLNELKELMIAFSYMYLKIQIKYYFIFTVSELAGFWILL